MCLAGDPTHPAIYATPSVGLPASPLQFLRIAGQTDFYGLLANEELGYVGTVPVASYTPSEDDVVKAGKNAGLARAMELIRLGLRTEGVREWLFTIRHFNDRQLLAAAQSEDRAIVTENVADFIELHRASLLTGETHAGIVFTSPKRFPRTRRAIGRLVRSLDGLLAGTSALDGEVVWLE